MKTRLERQRIELIEKSRKDYEMKIKRLNREVSSAYSTEMVTVRIGL